MRFRRQMRAASVATALLTIMGLALALAALAWH